MPGLLSAIGKFLTRDLTWRTWQREASHPYFQRLLYFGSQSPTDCYWEAEISSGDQNIGVNMTGTPDGPTPEEEEFCKSTLADLDALFERCRPAFAPTYTSWARQPLPASWRSAFKLDGFQVPRHGDPQQPWEVCYFVEPAGRYFTAVFEGGAIQRVDVDG